MTGKEFQQGFLRVQAIFGFVPRQLWGHQRVVTDFFTTVRRQAVHKEHMAAALSSSAALT